MPARVDIMVVCKLPTCNKTFKSRKTKVGYQEYCSRDCWFRRSEILLIAGEKECTSCHIIKPFSKFNKNIGCVAGVASRCAQCSVEYSRTYAGRTNARLKARCSLYNLSVDQYNLMLQKQDNRCGACKEIFTSTPQIDHDHACCNNKNYSCGKCVRGLLCGDCNNLLARAKDSIERLQSAISYLQQINERR